MPFSCWTGSIGSRGLAAAAIGAVLLLVGVSGSRAEDPLDRRFHNWYARKFHNIQRQRTDFSCGAASLAIIAQQYWNKPVQEVEFTATIRKNYTNEQWRAVEKNGFSLLDLKRAAVKLGFSAEGLKMTLPQLRKVKGPVMVHLDKGAVQHFSVFKGIIGDRVYLADPIEGNSRVPLYRFQQEWTGYTLAMWVENTPLPAINKLAPDPNDIPVETTAARESLYHGPDLTFYPFNY